MSKKRSSSADAGNGVATLLKASATESPSLDSTIELSRHLDFRAIASLEGVVQETIASGELDGADSILKTIERAAQLAGIDAIRYWARIERGMIAARQQHDTRAGSLFEEGFEYLDSPGVSDEDALLYAYTAAGAWLCDRALHEGKAPEARKILVRMLRRTSAARAADLEARIVVKFLWLSLSINDLASAEEHALHIIDGSVLEAIAGDDKFKEEVLDLLRWTATRLYEAGEAKYGPVRRLARTVVNEAGPDGGMFLLLATAAFTLEDFSDSLVWLDRLLEVPQEAFSGYCVSKMHLRRAICLERLNRNEESLEAIQQSIQSEPADPYVRFAAAQLYQSVDFNRAIDEYVETIRLCRERLAKSEPEEPSRAQPRSMREYQESTPVEDLRDFAIIRYSLCLREVGKVEEAVASLQTLVSTGDEVSRVAALKMLADWAEEDGRLKEAADLLGRARAVPSWDSDEIELRLASVLISMHSFDQAVDVLVPLCHKSRKPEECIKLMDRIPSSWSGFSRLLKWRGYAKTEAGWPRKGLTDLNAALKASPSDADTLFLRALARITFAVQPGQERWNETRSMKHIRESLDDLYAALKLKPDHEEARRVLKWLVERAAANPEMFEIFSAGGTREGDLFIVFPGLRPAFQAWWRANDLGFERKFDQCALAWNEAMQIYEQEGFEILAARVNIRLADVYLRLLDLDQAAANLERAEQLQFLVDVPLSRDVLDQYNDFAKSRGVYQKPTLGREVEYSWIYEHTVYDDLKLTFVKANYRHRLGDIAGALECVDLLEPVIIAELPATLGPVFGIEEVMWLVGILRDGGRYDDALRLLDSLQAYAAETRRSFDVLYMRGLLHDVKGESSLAIDAYEKAFALTEQRSRPVGVAPYVQYVASLLNIGRDVDALQALQKIDVEHDADSDRDRLLYYTVAAYVYGTRLAYPEALEAVEKAIAIVEERRAEIPDPASRRAWQGKQENLFSIAVKLYTATGQPRRAWRAVELSKARTLLDELEGREMLSPEHAALIGDLETIERATYIVEREINRDTTDEASAALRTEAVAELSQLLEIRFHDILNSTSFAERDFPAIKEMLSERWNGIVDRERCMKNAASAPTGVVIGLDEVAHLLEE